MNFGWGKAALVAGLLLAGCGRSEPVDPNAGKAEAVAFLEKNAKAEGVVTLPSGLQYKVVQSGPAGGVSPDRNDLVKVDYEGKLIDDTVFDSSFARGAPAIFTPEEVVKGWTEALQKMHVGDEWILYVPPELGYGERASPKIPANSVLIFRLKLLDVAKAPGGGSGVGARGVDALRGATGRPTGARPGLAVLEDDGHAHRSASFALRAAARRSSSRSGTQWQ
jgi:peptidylprolyl isomerase/FKBP-type peptidyl-prolyl cis-trans isomerase FklB